MPSHCRVYLSQASVKLIHQIHYGVAGVSNIDRGKWHRRYNLLKRTKTFIKLTLSTATYNGKAKLEAPITLVPSSLNGRYNRCIGHTFEFMEGLTRIVCIVLK